MLNFIKKEKQMKKELIKRGKSWFEGARIIGFLIIFFLSCIFYAQLSSATTADALVTVESSESSPESEVEPLQIYINKSIVATEPNTEAKTETETVTERKTEHQTQPATEQVTERKTERQTEPTTEQITERKTEHQTEPVTEQVTKSELTTSFEVNSDGTLKGTAFSFPIYDWELDLIVKAVQHEVGNNPSYFPGYDFDYIQQCMAGVILNHVGKPDFAGSVYGVLTDPGHFMPLENLARFSATDKQTLKNVLAVIYGKVHIDSNVIFEMSFTSPDMGTNQNKMESLVGKVEIYHTAVTADNRYLVYASNPYLPK